MTQVGEDGKPLSYLASEEKFDYIKEMYNKNLIIPVVGNFSGPKTIRAIGAYVRDHGATVSAFYVSRSSRICAATARCRTSAPAWRRCRWMPTSVFIRPGNPQNLDATLSAERPRHGHVARASRRHADDRHVSDGRHRQPLSTSCGCRTTVTTNSGRLATARIIGRDGDTQGKDGSGGKVTNRLVALSSAAVLTVYSAGYLRTRAAADRMRGRRSVASRSCRGHGVRHSWPRRLPRRASRRVTQRRRLRRPTPKPDAQGRRRRRSPRRRRARARADETARAGRRPSRRPRRADAEPHSHAAPATPAVTRTARTAAGARRATATSRPRS